MLINIQCAKCIGIDAVPVTVEVDITWYNDNIIQKFLPLLDILIIANVLINDVWRNIVSVFVEFLHNSKT